MRRIKQLPLLLLPLLLLSACSEPEQTRSEPARQQTAGPTLEERAWQQIRTGALLVDVRTPAEFNQGHLDGAINIPFDRLEARAAELGDDPDREIVLYCRTGRRAEIGEKVLEKLGFTRVLNARSYHALLRSK